MEEILREFYDLRLKMYEKMKAYMVVLKRFSFMPAWCCQKGSKSNPILSGGKFGWRGEKVVEPGAVHLGEV